MITSGVWSICPAARAAAILAVATGTTVAPAAAAAAPAWSAITTVKAVYRQVLLAEYFGPASGVCGRLTDDGITAYTEDRSTCDRAFDQTRLAIRGKAGARRGGALAWRKEVRWVVQHLRVTISGDGGHATATDTTGVFFVVDRRGRAHPARLVELARIWKFASAPPLPG